MKDLFVRRVYTLNGIGIVLELDFVKKTVSLVEKDGKPKNWKFVERTPQYLKGWRDIMKAMEYAVEQAQFEMDALDKKEHEDFVKMYMQLDKALKKAKGEN